MAEYIQRERQFTQNMGHTVGAFCKHIVEADGHAKWQSAMQTLALVNHENVDIHANFDLLPLSNEVQLPGLKFGASLPPVLFAKTNPVEMDDAHLRMTMNVSATTEVTDSLKVDAEGEAKAGIQLGPFGHISVNIKANVAVDKTKKRKSDYRAETEVYIHFKQGETPEGVQLICDCLNSMMAKSLDFNETILEEQIAQMHAARATVQPITPEEPPMAEAA